MVMGGAQGRLLPHEWGSAHPPVPPGPEPFKPVSLRSATIPNSISGISVTEANPSGDFIKLSKEPPEVASFIGLPLDSQHMHILKLLIRSS
ncbi:hypothetical protein V6N11_029977 [Hibiscus sabdariffa]|uniref:Uncharacterized protein n=1 Tax=Hibiscus sabdariffa TaxID=183260 RepID=A0ABR2PJU3_9ROSI